MTCTTYRPHSDLNKFQQEVDQFLGSIFGQPQRRESGSHFYTGQDANGYSLEAALPGLDPASIQLKVENRVLSLSAKRADRPADVRWHLRERATGDFTQQIRLPENVNVEGISADYTSGLLTVTLPKAESAKPREIEVRVS